MSLVDEVDGAQQELTLAQPPIAPAQFELEFATPVLKRATSRR